MSDEPKSSGGITPKCRHRPIPELRYMEAIDDAEQRLAAGEEQGVCVWCCKYVWAGLFFSRTDYLEAADAADSRLAAIAYESRKAKLKESEPPP